MRRNVERYALPALILLANVLIVSKLFRTEYLAYLESNEGTFIALSKHIADKPWDLGWWPLWECGLPFVNTYLPGVPLFAGWIARLSHESPALAFHQLGALMFCLAPVFVYWLVLTMTGRASISFFSALAYTALSPCAWLSPLIRADLFDPFRLRRLQNLVYYGEAPLTAAMAMFAASLWMLELALQRKRAGWWVLAGVCMGLTVLLNAFGATLLALASICWITTVGREQFRRAFVGLSVTTVAAYAWISPLVPPSVIHAIRANSPTVDGDFRFTSRSLMGVAILTAAALLTWFITRNLSRPLRFFSLFALLSSGVVLLGTSAQIYIFPQPHRYQLAMDLGLCVFMVLAVAQIAQHPTARRAAAIVGFVFLVWAVRHNVRYGRDLIRALDMRTTAPYRIAEWANQNLQGGRVMIFGSHIFQFNDFTDTPQLFGGHKPFVTNPFLRVVEYAMQSDENAGDKAGEISVLWLKALGASAVVVPGEASAAHYKPPHPHKFDGLLPVLWSQNGDTIYGVPARSRSLAHVIPETSLVYQEPIHGLDVDRVRIYLNALEDASLPQADWQWLGSEEAKIHAKLQPGFALLVQTNYNSGWNAVSNGKPVKIGSDALGLMVLRPDCAGDCEITLRFDGGTEASLARIASVLAMLGGAFALFLSWRVRSKPATAVVS